MRNLLLGPTSALALSTIVLCAPAPARADGLHGLMRLSGQMSQVDRLNRSRPRDQVYVAIAHQIDMINDRFADLQGRRVDPAGALRMIDDSLYAILQYNDNAGFSAPFVNAQIRRIASEMRADIAEMQAGGGGDWRPYERRRDRGYGYGYGYGYGHGYGYGRAGTGYLPGAYVPPPAPAPRAYVPPPAPVYAPAPPAYPQEPCEGGVAVNPVRY